MTHTTRTTRRLALCAALLAALLADASARSLYQKHDTLSGEVTGPSGRGRPASACHAHAPALDKTCSLRIPLQVPPS